MTYKEKDYRVFTMFEKDWALVTAGTTERFNSGSFANVGVWLSGKSFPASITVVVGAILFAQQ